MEFSLLSVEIKLAVEVCHCDPVVVSTDAGFSRATRILLHLLMALAKASLVDCQVRLLIDLAHQTLWRNNLVLLVGDNGIRRSSSLTLTVQINLYRAVS